jgi:hypothetical protein
MKTVFIVLLLVGSAAAMIIEATAGEGGANKDCIETLIQGEGGARSGAIDQPCIVPEF